MIDPARRATAALSKAGPRLLPASQSGRHGRPARHAGHLVFDRAQVKVTALAVAVGAWQSGLPHLSTGPFPHA